MTGFTGYCFAFGRTPALFEARRFNILGDTFMRGLQVVFDSSSIPHRIGFATVNVTHCGNYRLHDDSTPAIITSNTDTLTSIIDYNTPSDAVTVSPDGSSGINDSPDNFNKKSAIRSDASSQIAVGLPILLGSLIFIRSYSALLLFLLSALTLMVTVYLS